MSPEPWKLQRLFSGASAPAESQNEAWSHLSHRGSFLSACHLTRSLAQRKRSPKGCHWALTAQDVSHDLAAPYLDAFSQGFQALRRRHHKKGESATMLTTTPRAGGSRLQSVFRVFSRQLHGQKRRSGNSKGFQGPEGHGENIWIFCHRRTNQIIYSFNEKLEVCR